MRARPPRPAAFLAAASLLLGGCLDVRPGDGVPQVASSGVPGDVAGIDRALVRDDLPCDEEALGSTTQTPLVTAHWVVEGTLGAVCLGDEDATLVDAWHQLSTITPPEQLRDLGIFAGFASGDDDDDILAFVNVLDDDGTTFQMSVNLDLHGEDEAEAWLTLAHEFSHVLTSLPDQLDRSVDAGADCPTWFTGEGCFRPDSLLARWIEQFWGDGLLDELDPTVEADPDDGERRCELDGRFLGAYAASNPEEDFAESFSAFVFRVEPTSPSVDDKLAWFAQQPELAAFRDRAVAAGLGPLPDSFGGCGTA